MTEQACRAHLPIVRPTFFNFPRDEACYADSDDFMLGDDLLVAPVVTPGARERSVYLPSLPDGGQWFDFDTRQAYASGQTHTVAAPLARLPLFVREGARIPVAAPPAGQVPRHDDPVSEVLQF